MCQKNFLQVVICLLLIQMHFIQINAQKSRAEKGRLFINAPRSDNNVTITDIDLNSRDHKVKHSDYRSFDGTNNNINNYKWGAADIALFREMPAEYGNSDPKNAMNGVNRPSARKISNVVIDEPVTTFNERGLSAFVYVWGQFLDHDMTLTPTDTKEYVPIKLPADEVVFTEEIPFYRSEVRNGTGGQKAREQTNLNTAWIDASQVYGADLTRAMWLRTLKDGKMKTSAGNLLPFNTMTGELSASIDPNAPGMANDGNKTIKTFVAGDVRAAEHPGLISLHTLFVREHNRICDRLIAQGYKNDEDIYQKARKEVGAIIEAITYQEFLPAIGVRLRGYKGYNDNSRPDIANSFATASYRLGHTMVADDILLIDNQCDEIPPGELDLVDVFWNPQLIVDYNLEPFLKGLAAHTQYETDTKINSVLRNFLFGNPSDPVRFGIDLGSLNIQRGRDHGLPNYNAFRKFYTGKAAGRFSDITSNDTLATALKNLYSDINNIDVWVGLLAEDHLHKASVGKTLHEMVRVQFEKLRDGDFYFYLNDPFLPSNIRNKISNTKFSDVLKRNTSLTNLQNNVFFTEECPGEIANVSSKPNAITKNSDVTTADIKVYPNPAGTIVNIDLGNLYQKISAIQIVTVNGVLAKNLASANHKKILQLNTSDLSKGLYYINIISGKEIKTLKFVKL